MVFFPTCTFADGCACRFSHHWGLFGAPQFEAMRIKRPASGIEKMGVKGAGAGSDATS